MVSLNTSFKFATLASAVLFVGVLPMDGLSLLPGDIGDARFNNYILENIYQFLNSNLLLSFSLYCRFQ